MKRSNARFLIMGGQACVLYGAAEFSRDLDLAIGAAPADIEAVEAAIRGLGGEQIYFPGLDPAALERGHACHFRCHAAGAEGLRIDLMSRLRGCAAFDELWERRTILELPEIGTLGALSLPDLVRAKKTQRDKDWPMIRRLIETDHLRFRADPTPAQVRFWLSECRTPSLLVDLSGRFPGECGEIARERPLLTALPEGAASVEAGLAAEEQAERGADRLYWAPLLAELEKWRKERPR